jgi:antitoxin CptB
MSSLAPRLSRARFRAWHRGTREADYMIGGFFDRYHAGWTPSDLDWFEALLEEDDVEIMAWALGAAEVAEKCNGQLMLGMQKLDNVNR